MSIMRLAVYEMKYLDDIPVSVSINEAVELAKTYGGEDDPPLSMACWAASPEKRPRPGGGEITWPLFGAGHQQLHHFRGRVRHGPAPLIWGKAAASRQERGIGSAPKATRFSITSGSCRTWFAGLPSIFRPCQRGSGLGPSPAGGGFVYALLYGGLGIGGGAGRLLEIPLYRFTHQQGHVAAAVYGTGCPDLLASPFLAFHVSGGTTDALLVRPDAEEVIRCEEVASSMDLKAGQLIDRVGRMLGLPFPGGTGFGSSRGWRRYGQAAPAFSQGR